MSSISYDIIIFGSGFGGSLLAMIARRLGLSALLVERGAHPRFAIGESTSPLANLLLEEMAARYDLPFLRSLASYGPWQRAYPDVACGLKRGFTFFAHRAGEPYAAAPGQSSRLMVAASPDAETADTHWFRADVDHFLVRRAIETGVHYQDRTAATALERNEAEGWTVAGEREGRPWAVSGRLLIDATGPHGLLHRLLKLPEASFAGYPPTQALYTHFDGVARCDALAAFQTEGPLPYPMDDAALHHVFHGGWMWALRFNNGITSAGFAVTDGLARELGLPGDPEIVWRRFLDRFPAIALQFAAARPVQPFVYAPRLTFRSGTVAGEGWALLPSAAAFIDPLFSTGIALTLLGVERLARILSHAPEGSQRDERLRDYGAITLSEADSTARYIGACYQAMSVFDAFASMTMFYFAAASYSEMTRRLQRPHLVTRFLAADHPEFAAGQARCRGRLPFLLSDPDPYALSDFERLVAASVDCINIAGLCDPQKRGRYPVDLEDVVRGAYKLGMTPDQMRQALAAAPWANYAGLAGR